MIEVLLVPAGWSHQPGGDLHIGAIFEERREIPK